MNGFVLGSERRHKRGYKKGISQHAKADYASRSIVFQPTYLPYCRNDSHPCFATRDVHQRVMRSAAVSETSSSINSGRRGISKAHNVAPNIETPLLQEEKNITTCACVDTSISFEKNRGALSKVQDISRDNIRLHEDNKFLFTHCPLSVSPSHIFRVPVKRKAEYLSTLTCFGTDNPPFKKRATLEENLFPFYAPIPVVPTMGGFGGIDIFRKYLKKGRASRNRGSSDGENESSATAQQIREVASRSNSISNSRAQQVDAHTDRAVVDDAAYVSHRQADRTSHASGSFAFGSVQRSEASSGRKPPGKKRKPDKVYDYVELVPNTETYRCRNCNQILGKRNTTRFKKHCVEQCRELHTPMKRELRMFSKSRNIGDPQGRSRLGLALERTNEREYDDPTTTATDVEVIGHCDPHEATVVKRASNSRHSTGSGDSKKRKSSSNTSPIYGVSNSDTLVSALLEFIIMKGVPFNLFDPVNGRESEAEKLFKCLNPSFSRALIPNGRTLSGKLLDKFYLNIKVQVESRIKSALRQGYGSLIFDGWDDVNSSPVVNVLLRTEGHIDAGRRIFFLASVYTGSQKSGAAQYVEILEKVMAPYGGFERICAITSDNTSSCLNTRRSITSKHCGIVGVNDQSHVADLLMEDIGSLQWIKDVLLRVSLIARELHNRRKLKARFRHLIVRYNDFLKTIPTSSGIEEQPQNPQEGSTSRLSSGLGGDRDPSALSRSNNTANRTAIMLKQSSNTRFASSEGVLESFLRSLTVLRALVEEEDFETLFKPRNVAAKKKRDDEFVGVIKDQVFAESVGDVYRLMVVLRRYLRTFDGDEARISEVLPFTMAIERNIERLPITDFFTEERKAEVLNFYHRRRDGPVNRTIKVRLLEDIHYVAHMLDPNLCPDDALSYIQRFRAHAKLYATSINAVDVDSTVNRLVLNYMSQRELWRRDRDGMTRKSNLELYRGNALMWWYAGNCKDQELQEFAVRTLSCSPTACAVERSFSAQKKLQPKERNRLSQNKVKKMIFCYWNINLMRNLDLFDKQKFWSSVGNALRALSPQLEGYDSAGEQDHEVESDIENEEVEYEGEHLVPENLESSNDGGASPQVSATAR